LPVLASTLETLAQRRVAIFLSIALIFCLATKAHSFPAELAARQSAASPQYKNETIRAARLRCEYLENPLGIEALRPRLSWQLEAMNKDQQTGEDLRGLRQTAYRILVASSASLLAKDAGDLWDTGKTLSNLTIQLGYSGKELKSNRMYYWKVRVWDQRGSASEWSDTARWQMGLLHAEDWKAKWIAAEPDVEDADANAKKITNPPPPRPLPIFRHGFNLAKPVARAVVYISGLGQY
jgi:alpha-L-rhamnosidase